MTAANISSEITCSCFIALHFAATNTHPEDKAKKTDPFKRQLRSCHNGGPETHQVLHPAASSRFHPVRSSCRPLGLAWVASSDTTGLAAGLVSGSWICKRKPRKWHSVVLEDPVHLERLHTCGHLAAPEKLHTVPEGLTHYNPQD